MNNLLAEFVLVNLIAIAMTGCSPQSPAPREATGSPTRAEKLPHFWLDAKTRVSFAGSSSNLTLIARNLGEGMHRRAGPGFVWAIFGARGHAYFEGLVALGEGTVDFAVITPPVTGLLAAKGKGYFPKAYPNLRAIAVYPQNDWLGCAVRADLGVSSFEDIKARRIPLKLATGPMGKTDGVGFLTEQILAAYGITRKDIEAWGGKIFEESGAPGAVQKVVAGEADMVCHEFWKAFMPLTDKLPVRFLPVSDAVLNQLEKEFGYKRKIIPKGIYRPNVPDREVPAVDFSDWVVLTTTALPDDLAYLAAKVAVEDRADLEILYMGQEERQRSMDLPLKPELMGKNVGVPLHPGAEKYYREAGHLH